MAFKYNHNPSAAGGEGVGKLPVIVSCVAVIVHYAVGRSRTASACNVANHWLIFTPILTVFRTMYMLIMYYSPSGNINTSGVRTSFNILSFRKDSCVRKCNFISWPYLCFSLQRAGIYLSQVQTISSITLHNTVTCYLMKCDFFCSFFMNSFGESHHNYGFVLLQTKKVVIITNGKPRIKQVLSQVLHVLFKQSCLSYIHSSCH